jgi:CheY-like chemotaxis protein
VRLDRFNGEKLRLRVTDTGRGISPNFLPYVFDRFRQADASSTRSHGGLGIGLTIVRHIVELHGGTVHAESAGEGQGSTFVVTLPAARPAGAAANGDGLAPVAAASSSASGNGRATDLTGLRIVVVDDEPDARDVISRVLSRAGATTTAAGSVREALAAITLERPDLIVSDIAMPDQDGYDLVRMVKEMADSNGGGPPIPALALTAYAREEDRQRCLSAGFQAHVAKPVDPSELLRVVAHWAHGAVTRREETSQLRVG